MNRTLANLRVAVAVLAVIPAAASAQNLGAATDKAACCSLTTSLAMDAIRGNDIQGDERFFMTEGAPPNIHFLIDDSGSMQELPQVKNSDEDTFFNSTVPISGSTPAAVSDYDGCNNTFLQQEETRRSWNPATVYPIVDTGTGLGSDNGHPDLFRDASFYNYEAWGDSSSPPRRSETTVAGVCQTLSPGWNVVGSAAATRYARCQRCLNERGYYREPSTFINSNSDSWSTLNAKAAKFVFTGRFLNFNPPKYALLKAVLKSVIANLRRVRAGYSTFADDTNNTDGGKMRQKQNPSCKQIAKDSSSFDSNRSSYVNDIDGLSFGTSTPLAETLLNIGQYFSSNDTIYKTKYGLPNGVVRSEYSNGSLTSEGRSWCWGCQTSSVIIITDGAPTRDNWENSGGMTNVRNKLIALNGGEVKCPDYDGNGTGDCAGMESAKSGDMLDDVAKFLNTHDLQITTPATVGDMNSAGTQSMNIYGIGLGVQSPILRNATEGVGGGAYYEANDAAQLEQNILDILVTVQTRATAFAAATVSSLQINRVGGSLLPRFKPSKKGTKSAWQGYLYRFDLGQEKLLGCDPAQARTILSGGPGDPKDYNQDGDCEDIQLVDAANNAVVEDDQGNFVKLNDPLTPATPFWEFGSVLKPNPTAQTQVWKTRNIYTIVDSNNDGKIDARDTPIAFTEANAGVLKDYMGISANLNDCSPLAVLLGIGAFATPDDCAKAVIRYYRGADVLNPDPAKRDYDRPFLLNDVFHSSPVVVEPLSSKGTCSLGNQCLVTLGVDGMNKTDMSPPSGANAPDAYDNAVATYGARDRVALVGSNGGMLHAIMNGRVTGKDPNSGTWIYDSGTGKELWAFIPPDLLPKLRPSIGAHGYFVDGTAMVRDVWIDKNNDNIKQETEFRTVAVVNEGVGGTHRFALDLTRLIGSTPANGLGLSTVSHKVPDTMGDFLWIWPQPCDADALAVGESSTNFAPKPPPIGPVAIKFPGGKYKANGIEAKEKWVVFLNGGNDQYLMRGRSVAMVDIADGTTLWSFAHGDGSPNSDKLNFPIQAPVSMIDMGNAGSSAPDYDKLFDTATVGDVGGNVWTFRFYDPGVQDPITKKVTNWYAARSFRANSSDTKVIQPITQMTSNTLQPDTGFLRTFVGTGDRRNLMDTQAPVCRLSDPLACALQGCKVENTLEIWRGGTSVRKQHFKIEGGDYKAGDDTTTVNPAGPTCSQARVDMHWKIESGGKCSYPTQDGHENFVCDGGLLGWSCRNTQDDWATTASTMAAADLPTVSPDRFYGFWSYGVNPSRRFNTAAEATTFDGTALHEGNLVDVTSATITAGGTPTVASSSLGNGWVIRYVPPDERTGTSSTIIDGCVIWNSFEPSGGSAVCSTAGTNTARLYQGQYVSGAPSCAKTFFDSGTQTWSRYIARDVVAVPGDPSPQRTIFKGQGSSSIVTMEAGRNQGDSVSGSKELIKAVFQIPLDRSMHDCRHEGLGCE